MYKNQFDGLPDIESMVLASQSPNSKLIEPRFKETIDRYVADKCPTGGFIQAVLENDLSGAIGRADRDAMNNIRHIVAYCYNEIPDICWGSKKKVNEWMKS